MANEESNEPKLLGWLESVRQFWREVAREMRQVSWPARTEVVNTTIVVVVAVFFFALYLFLADRFFVLVIQGLEWIAKKIF